MNKKIVALVTGLSVLLPCASHMARANETDSSPKAAKEQNHELSNNSLDQRMKHVDGMLAYRSEEISKESRDLQASQNQSKDDRLAFEKRMAEEEKAFLSYLKTADVKERSRMLREFQAKQKKNRAE